jgi:hypothetical protein
MLMVQFHYPDIGGGGSDRPPLLFKRGNDRMKQKDLFKERMESCKWKSPGMRDVCKYSYKGFCYKLEIPLQIIDLENGCPPAQKKQQPDGGQQEQLDWIQEVL